MIPKSDLCALVEPILTGLLVQPRDPGGIAAKDNRDTGISRTRILSFPRVVGPAKTKSIMTTQSKTYPSSSMSHLPLEDALRQSLIRFHGVIWVGGCLPTDSVPADVGGGSTHGCTEKSMAISLIGGTGRFSGLRPERRYSRRPVLQEGRSPSAASSGSALKRRYPDRFVL